MSRFKKSTPADFKTHCASGRSGAEGGVSGSGGSRKMDDQAKFCSRCGHTEPAQHAMPAPVTVCFYP